MRHLSPNHVAVLFWFAIIPLAFVGCGGSGGGSEAPVAAFSATPKSGDPPLVVRFTNRSNPGSEPVGSRLWSFGDGATGTAQNPTHTYSSAGVYTVSLQIWTILGTDRKTKADFITVGGFPRAEFSASPRSGAAPLNVRFTDESDPGDSAIVGWFWAFGDGGSSTEQNPTHTYEEAGVYTVSLTVTNLVGSDTETRPEYILVEEDPTADFTASPREGSPPLEVEFTDGSDPGSASITSWEWTFGDGGTSAEQNPTHTYDSPGVYTVSLEVSTSVGSDTEVKIQYITVNAPQGPTVDFEGTPRFADAPPLEVEFTDLSSSGDAPITSWRWTFGDGGTSTEQNPTHTYEDYGRYTVSLTVTTSLGSGNETKIGYIIVGLGPTAQFSATPTSGFEPLEVQFTDESEEGPPPVNSWRWTFGDGQISTDPSPTHTYENEGTYTVSLRVTNLMGSDTETKQDYITVEAPSVDVYLLKTDAQGDVEWERTYGGPGFDDAHGVTQADDGGYVAVGHYSFGDGSVDLYVVKTDGLGEIEWELTCGGDGDDLASDVQQTSDGGYLVGGTASGETYLVKVDDQGDLAWERTYDGDRAWDVQQTIDGGYVVASSLSGDMYLVKTDAQGDVEWARSYGGANDDGAFGIRQTSDGGYVLAGYTTSFGAGGFDMYLVKTDGEGDVEWERRYGGAEADGARSVQQTTDGGYVLAGVTRSFDADGCDMYLVKTDALGNLEWESIYSDVQDDIAFSVQQTSDGGYVLAGYRSGNTCLVKTDAQGDVTWSRAYGRAYDELINDVQQTVDGGYVLAGNSYTLTFRDRGANSVPADENGAVIEPVPLP